MPEPNEIDREIAEKVMGWLLEIDGEAGRDWWRDKSGYKQWEYTWHPSTDIAQAFQVVEKMREQDYWFSIVYKTEMSRDGERELPPAWWARFRCVQGGTRPDGYDHADTPEMAICKAALRAVE